MTTPTEEPLLGAATNSPMMTRRRNRGRRMAAVAVLAFTTALFIAETYLRYDLPETQYIMALTLHNESARAILRNVVRRELESGVQPNPQHVEALAAIEEDEVILLRYQEAYGLNPNSWELVLNYGARLFLAGRFSEARDRFREAGVQDPRNALPRYLEAAALAVSQEQDTDLSEALAIIERANVSDLEVRFPEPLWHPSMPRRGTWYQQKQREIVDRCCAPLYRFKNQVAARVRAEGAETAFQWDDWLNTVQEMAQHLAEGRGTEPVIHLGQLETSIQIQMDVLKLRGWLAEQTAQLPAPEWKAQEDALTDARMTLADFETARAAEADRMRNILLMPLLRVAETIFALLLLVCCCALGARLVGIRKFGRDQIPPRWTLMVSMLLTLGYMSLLGAYSFVYSRGPDAFGNMMLVNVAWVGWACLAVALGLILPILYTPRNAGAPIKKRAGEYLGLVQRAWEDQLTALIFAGCGWFIFSRIVLGVYPTKLELLVPGLELEMQAVARKILQQIT